MSNAIGATRRGVDVGAKARIAREAKEKENGKPQPKERLPMARESNWEEKMLKRATTQKREREVGEGGWSE